MKRKIEISIFLAFAIVACCFCMGNQESEETSEETSEVAIVAQPFENPHESELIEAALDWHYVDDCLLTAYCPCEECSGCYGNGTATGVTAHPDHTIAVDPSVIPLGAWVEIDGDPNSYHAEDVGGCVNGNHIDVYFDSHEEALNFNMRTETVRWYE